MKRTRVRAASAAVVVLIGSLSLGACSSAGTTPTSAGSGAANAAFPAKVTSCDEQLTITKAPSRVIMLGDTDASVLVKLDLLDKVVGRAGALRTVGYDAATLAKITAIPEIKSTTLDTGGSKVSTETILEQRADLVIGYDTGLDRAALRQAGVPVYSPASFCANYSVKKADFGLVDTEVTTLGALFGVPDKAKDVVSSLDAQVLGLNSATSSPGTGTIAVLYITAGSKTFYAYGTSSMVQPIAEANGLRNVYDDQVKRVLDASMEDLLKRNPDRVLLLYGDGAPDQAMATFTGFSGADSLSAVKNHRVMVMAFSLTDPPTPLSVDGAVELGRLLKVQP